MRSILAKILLWSLVTFVLSLVAYRGISRALERHGPRADDPFWRMSKMIEDDICVAYDEGGPKRLALQLERLDQYLPGKHLLTDSKGRDLVTGEDHADLLRIGKRREGPPLLADGRLVLISPPRGKSYRFITLVEPWFEPPNLLPYFGVVVLVIAGMGAILAAHLAAPLRRLRLVVERFGRGDLSARAGSKRKDEIGEVSRAFDEMADRIEVLLSAERRLLQDVSHELRSPLARLGFAVELAREDDEREQALARVRKEADRMTSLVGELLQLTRIEGDPTADAPLDVQLDPLLRDIAADCQVEAAARGCRLVLRVNQDAVISGRSELIHRAVENIVRNAIRHTAEGTAVEITLDRATDDAAIVVRDHGPGVPEPLLADIFKPFFRVEDDRGRSSGGVGLGLAIARRAVEVHHGKITARNTRPGLAITVELPAVEADRDSIEP